MSTFLTVPLTDAEAAAAAGSVVVALIFSLVFYVIGCLGLMGIFTKAGQPGWAAFVPIYNTIVLLQVVGRPLWWFLLLLVPGVNVVALIIIMHDLSKSFGHDAGFTVGLVLLSVVFTWILWLGSSTYRGPAAAAAGSTQRPSYA
ncbi:signal peptidase I [Cellulomonas sp. zg-ZUI222]|uniref:Signal peptidase I n=1 Tax=Cellulomonas wangleii TaxID=2816956 RepID=A0ABX8D8J3_9CELL|nr:MULTISPECIES: DUF5684 domain-containing protein [Cellulomonas]MBO0900924.1 signal peptidase I [Cellulomonas sp. zg-ZUI22]MBO0921579.1 signal peptidase I [Cellulomonas wangleii]MBO0925075.1 signal peptidase I [Cellulomonas wangleii]QVI63511.1 signal peptidase I [Cellulomonas wangleii]